MSIPFNLAQTLAQRAAESDGLEYKAGFNPKVVLGTLCAFANDFYNIGGGVLVIGVQTGDDGLPLPMQAGLSFAQAGSFAAETEKLARWITPSYNPKISVEQVAGLVPGYFVLVQAFGGDDRPYSIPDPPAAPEQAKRLVYKIRQLSSSIEASGEDLAQLMLLQNNIPFDDRFHPSATYADLSHALLLRFVQATNFVLPPMVLPETATTAELVHALDVGRDGRVRHVGLMFFTEQPKNWFPGLEIVLHRGDAKHIITGPVDDMVRHTLDELQRNDLRHYPETNQHNVPFAALEEAVANALYHRGYDLPQPVEIYIEHNGLRVVSQPGPMGGIPDDWDNITARRYRNRRIGAFLQALHLTEGLASGLPRIKAALEANQPGSRAKFTGNDARFEITLPLLPPPVVPIPANAAAIILQKTVAASRIAYFPVWEKAAVLQSIVAFANDWQLEAGGYLVIGMAGDANNQPILPANGIDLAEVDQIQKDLLDMGQTQIRPRLMPRLSRESFDARQVLLIHVPAGEQPPYKILHAEPGQPKQWVCFLRKAGRNCVASHQEEAELMEAARRVPFDEGGHASATLADLSPAWMQRFLQEVGSKLAHDAGRYTTLQLAEQLDLLQGPPEKRLLRNVALMMFCERPDRFFPQTQINVVYFPSGPAGRNAVTKQFFGPVFHQLREALAYIEQRYIEEIITKSPDRAEAEKSYNMPLTALDEALANAVYHRSYRIAEPVEVRITPQQIVIISFPELDPRLDIEDVRQGKIGPRLYRNRRLGEFLRQLRLAEGLGTGIAAIRRSMAENGSPEPIFESKNTAFIVTLPMKSARLEVPAEEDVPSTLIHASTDVVTGEAALVAGVRVDVARLAPYAPARLLGREGELARLRAAWAEAGTQPSPPIFAIIALGGEGKTSLLVTWMLEMQADGWRGAQTVFAWSFYSQGSSEQSASSSDMFLAAALHFIGEPELAASKLVAYEKGQKLAACCARQRTLLILDGLEPLQYAPTSPTRGELRDQGMLGLLRGLGAQGGSGGGSLCVLTSRYALPQIAGHCHTIDLPRLPKQAAIALLRAACPLGADADYEQAVEEVKGHALALHILAQYVKEAHGGDIRQRDLMDWQEADTEETHGHAFRAMAAYGKWLAQDESIHGARALALLHVLGLFDRPAERRLVQALLQTDAPLARLAALRGLAEKDWNICIQRLAEAGMLSRNPAQGAWQSLDAHPLLREYFARHWQEQDAAGFRAAHKVLFEFLRANTKEGDQPNLADLLPLYQAVAHGCWAGEVEAALDEVYWQRIVRGEEAYSSKKLGAHAQDLAAIACFFPQPWQQVTPGLSEAAQAWLLNEAAFSLRALGRLAEAVQPLQAGVVMQVARQDWKNAAIQASNLTGLHLLLGQIAAACSSAQQALAYAEQSGDVFWRMICRTTLADAQHQAGQEAAALALMQEAERMQAEDLPESPLLYSVWGFRYCELLLASGTANAQQVVARARQTLVIAERNHWLLDIALDHLTLARCALQQALPEARAEVGQALAGLRQSSNSDYLPLALLTRAAVLCRTEPVAAIADLNESFDLCQRGPMPLFMADTLLTRVRLFAPRAAQHLDAAPYPWPSPQADLQEARRIIDECGYERRRAELEELSAQYVQPQPG